MLEWARRAAVGLPKRSASPKTKAALTAFRDNRVQSAKACGIEYPKACPHCAYKEIIRAGIASGSQRYRCRRCGKTFGLTPVSYSWTIMCYRCGTADVHRSGSAVSGSKAYCPQCKRGFTQGGQTELDRNQMILKMRTELLEIPSDVAREVYQQAVLDVLSGKGYCWTVEFDLAKAWRNARGAQCGYQM